MRLCRGRVFDLSDDALRYLGEVREVANDYADAVPCCHRRGHRATYATFGARPGVQS